MLLLTDALEQGLPLLWSQIKQIGRAIDSDLPTNIATAFLIKHYIKDCALVWRPAIASLSAIKTSD